MRRGSEKGYVDYRKLNSSSAEKLISGRGKSNYLTFASSLWQGSGAAVALGPPPGARDSQPGAHPEPLWDSASGIPLFQKEHGGGTDREGEGR